MKLNKNNFVENLDDNEIFVFASNMNGFHGGGSALQALVEFGALYGNPIGIQGQSYAIPTLDENLCKLPLKEIKKHINDLIDYAKQNTDKTFLLTPIGTGIAGFTFKEINSIIDILPKNIIKVGNWE
jgi:hypothetical protein